MVNFNELREFLVELKKSGQLSKENEKRVDEFVEFLNKFLKNKKKTDLIKAIILAAKVLWEYFKRE